MENIFVASMWKEMLFTTPLRQQKQLCGGSNLLRNDMSQLNRNKCSLPKGENETELTQRMKQLYNHLVKHICKT